MTFKLYLPAATGGGTELVCESFDEATHAATGCEHPHESNPILPHTDELIWGVIAFLILLAGMWKWGIPAVQRAIDARAERIRNDLDAAEQARVQAESARGAYERQLNEARNEGNRIIEQARQDAERMRVDLVAAAQAEVADLKARANADIESARQQAVANLENDVKELTIQLAEKVVQHNLDAATQRQLIDGFIAEVAR